MKRILMISLVPAVLVLAATVLVIRAEGGDSGDERRDTPAAEQSATTATTRARPALASTAPSTTTAPAAAHAACTAAAIRPVVAAELEAAAGGALHIVAVDLQQCRNGYARVFAVPDNARCGDPGGACLDNEQVFLADHGGQWSYLTSGTGIACEADDDLSPTLLAACRALGLRP